MRLFEDLRDAPAREHAIHAKSYFNGARGGALLAASALRTQQRSVEELKATLAAAPDLEMILHSAVERTRWTGTSDLVVVVTSASREQRVRAGSVVGFNLRGDTVHVPTTSRHFYPLLFVRPVQRSFGIDPEGRRQRAPRRSGNTISTTGDEFISPMYVTCEDDPTQEVCQEPPPPPPPAVEGYVLPSGYSLTACKTPSMSGGDQDLDGIGDQCEFELAYAFRPFLAISLVDDDPRRESYWSVGHARADEPFHIRIYYAMAYYYDGGSPVNNGYKHLGDSEFNVLRITYEGGRWKLYTVTMSAHWMSDAESTETRAYGNFQYLDGVYRGRPLIWVAEDKHANYMSSGVCDRGAYYTDNCDQNVHPANDPAFQIEVLPNANLGNRYNYFGGVPIVECPASRAVPTAVTECFWRDERWTIGAFSGYVERFRGWRADVGDYTAGPYVESLKAYDM